jgi:cytochrome c oxidase cbb3-type subunit 4
VNDVHTYESLRQFVDSWGLLATAILFLVLVSWPFRPSAKKINDDAAHMIFEEDDNG